MRDLLFLAADVWLMATAFVVGVAFLRRYGNHFLGLECLVVATSATNFLVWALTGGDPASPLYRVAYALDAFSRSFGITLILVLGLLAVTHGYRPPRWVEVGSFALAGVAGVWLGGYADGELHVGIATFYLVMNLLTTAFLAYVVRRLWVIGAKGEALLTAVVTAAATGIALTYDVFPFGFDDANRTLFYTAALTTWGAQGVAYYLAYRALHDHRTTTSTTTTTHPAQMEIPA